MSATRLPGKPLLKINDLSIISHVFKKAEKANIGEVIVETEDQEIVDDDKKNGGKEILRKKKQKNESERKKKDKEKIKSEENEIERREECETHLMNG